jgi:hypothetical protein
MSNLISSKVECSQIPPCYRYPTPAVAVLAMGNEGLYTRALGPCGCGNGKLSRFIWHIGTLAYSRLGGED